MRGRSWIAALLPLALILGGVALRWVDPPFVRDFRYAVFDTFQRIKPRPYAPAPVVVVDIDEATLDAQGQWPWPRTRVADLVDRLRELGAATIAMDVIFAEPDRTSPDQLIAEWRDTPALRPAARLLEESIVPSHDRLLAEAFGRARSVLGTALSNEATTPAAGGWGGIATIGHDPRPFLNAFSAAVTNLPVLHQAAAGVGALNVVPDFDGVVRRVPLLLRQGERIVPSLFVEALRVAQGASSIVIKSSGAQGVGSLGRPSGVSAVRVGNATVSTDAHGQLWLYQSPPVPQRVVSARTVLDGSADPARIRGKIVFVGASAAGLKDQHTTPLARALPGTRLQAQATEMAIHGNFLQRPAWAPGAEVLATLLAGLLVLAAFMSRPVGPIGLAALMGIILIALFVGSWWRFDTARQLLDPVYPALVSASAYVVATVLSYRQSEAEKRRVRHAFSHYLAPAMVERLTQSPDSLQLGGESRELTLLFCDIRGFTTLAESMSAAEITKLLNRFLTPMTDAIMASDGTVDKYMGDAIMAFWNAPLDIDGHASKALASVLEMRRCCTELNGQFEAEAREAGSGPAKRLAIGIGLNTGLCSVGNMGSRQRFDYSALGDNVNLASRLEGMCKVYAVDVVLSDATRAAAENLAFLELDLVQVKGRNVPTRVHTILGDSRMAAESGFLAQQAEHEAMLAAYRGRAWDEAERRLAAAVRADAEGHMQGYYDMMRRRIADFRRTPPPDDWDGSFIAESK